MKFSDIVKLYESEQSGPPYIVTDAYGDKFYYKNTENTILHREDGPAIIRFGSGAREWWKDGKLHREDGPAVERQDGGEEWYINHKRHRDGGPAFYLPGVAEYWYRHGKLHREDGPAAITPSDSQWALNDRYLTPDEVKELKNKLTIKKEIQGHKNNRIDPRMLEDYL